MASGGGGGGQTLAEVVTVAVVMVCSGDNNPAPHVYGSITVAVTSLSGDRLSYTVFDKARDQAVQVPENRPIQKTNIHARRASEIEVHADLWDARGGAPDHQIVNGSVVFTAKIKETDSKDITATDGGDVRVDVSWSTNPGELCGTMASGGGGGGGGGGQPVLATVGVVMVRSGNNDLTPQVYGSIEVVLTTPSGDQPDPISVFHKTRDQSVGVPVNTAIPLQMTNIHAQLGFGFEVRAHLSDAKLDGPPDHNIVNGTNTFTPDTDGVSSKDITASDGGHVKVNVVWST